MRIESTVKSKAFSPVTVTIALESEEDAVTLHAIALLGGTYASSAKHVSPYAKATTQRVIEAAKALLTSVETCL